MREIGIKLWSHDSESRSSSFDVTQIRGSTPRAISSYHELVRQIALISFHNPDLDLFYRGQSREWLNRKRLTVIQPSLFRNLSGKRADDAVISARFGALEKATELLRKRFNEKRLFGRRQVGDFPELCWAVLQHYEVCPTPLLDVTSSLRVAASFALS